MQQADAAHGKCFCRRQCVRSRQFNDQIDTAVNRKLGTGELVQNGNVSTLYKIAAHNGNNGIGTVFPHFLQVIQMSIV